MILRSAILLLALLLPGLSEGVRPVHADSLEAAELKGLPTIFVDGTICTLPDAIRAANDGSSVGGCVGSPGLDLIQLDVDVSLGAADTTHSSLVGAAHAGLPDVTSDIVLIAGAGSVIERDPSLGCEPEDPDSFRLLNVKAGNLYLYDLILRGGCVAPASGVEANGGAVYVSGGALELSGVVMEANSVLAVDRDASGGAMFCVPPAVLPAISDSTFDGNVVQSVSSVGSGTARGGAAFALSCSVGQVVDTVFRDNRAEGSSGVSGGGAEGGAFFVVQPIDEMAGVTFEGNLALGGSATTGKGGNTYGGGLYLVSAGGTIDGCTFVGNESLAGSSSGGDGGEANAGALMVTSGSIDSLDRTIFDDNVAEGGDAPAGETPGLADGGAVYSVVEISNVRETIWRGNRATVGSSPEPGGPAGAAGGALFAVGAIQIERSTFAGNLAAGGVADETTGGAIAAFNAITASNCTFDGNRAVAGEAPGSMAGGPAKGGAIFSTSALELRASTLARNEAIGATDTDGNGDGQGGAVWLSNGGNGTFADNLFDDNFSQDGGSASVANDCLRFGDPIVSDGYNLVEAPGTCAFAATGDQTGVDVSTYALADWGCQTTLPDGGCVATLAIDQDSPAADGGSCDMGLIVDDGREVPRPFDLTTVSDADDGCDVGAFEATDADGDGFTEAADCAPLDPSAAETDRCGVCGGDDSTCLLFEDDFESGDALAWSSTVG